MGVLLSGARKPTVPRVKVLETLECGIHLSKVAVDSLSRTVGMQARCSPTPSRLGFTESGTREKPKPTHVIEGLSS